MQRHTAAEACSNAAALLSTSVGVHHWVQGQVLTWQGRRTVAMQRGGSTTSAMAAGNTFASRPDAARLAVDDLLRDPHSLIRPQSYRDSSGPARNACGGKLSM